MLAYKILTAVNIALMLLLAWRTERLHFRYYLIVMAVAAGLQNTPWWGIVGETFLAWMSLMWLLSELPKGRRAITEALALGLFVAAILMLLVPRPWPMYSHAMFYTRIYSAAACAGLATPLAILDKRKELIIAWFVATLIVGGSVERGWNVTAVGIACNAAWTAILIAWNWMEGKDGERSTH